MRIHLIVFIVDVRFKNFKNHQSRSSTYFSTEISLITKNGSFLSEQKKQQAVFPFELIKIHNHGHGILAAEIDNMIKSDSVNMKIAIFEFDGRSTAVDPSMFSVKTVFSAGIQGANA